MKGKLRTGLEVTFEILKSFRSAKKRTKFLAIKTRASFKVGMLCYNLDIFIVERYKKLSYSFYILKLNFNIQHFYQSFCDNFYKFITHCFSRR